MQHALAADGHGRKAAPRVSIIVPAFNSAACITACIRSGLEQTERNIEVIVVDDGSSDGTQGVIEALAAADGRIRPFRHSENQGPGAARNTAIGFARGRWLALLDADDAFRPHRLEALCKRAEQSNCDLLADNLELQDAITNRSLGLAFPHHWMAGEQELSLAEFLRRDQPGRVEALEFGFAKPIIRREFIIRTGIRYAPDLMVGEDFLFYATCLAHGACFLTYDAAHYLHRIRPGSISRDPAAPEHMSTANRRLRECVGEGDAEILALLECRQNLTSFAAFANAVRMRRYYAAIRTARRMPKPYLAARLRELIRHKIAGRPSVTGTST
ncbi:MAG: glycosyltransferase [Hyphomicrobium sp.]